MIVIIRAGSTELDVFTTITSLGSHYPELSVPYMQKLGLGVKPRLYKNFYIYRVRTEDIKPRKANATTAVQLHRNNWKNKTNPNKREL